MLTCCRFIAVCSQPLRLIERQEFRDLLEYINPDTLCWLPRAHSTIGIWVERQFKAHRKRVMRNVKDARSKVHVSCDLWTSTNGHSILAVILIYVDANGKVRRTMAGMREILGNKTGERLCVMVMEIIKEWEIQLNLGYFMMDNAADNDVMMRHISLGLFPTSFTAFANKLP